MKKLSLIPFLFLILDAVEISQFISCEKGDKRACYEIASALYLGQDVAKDDSAAFLYFEKACKLSQNEACTNQAQMYEHGIGVKKDEKIALEMYEKACNGGSISGCKGAESIYETQKNSKKIAKIRENLCKFGEKEYCKSKAKLDFDNPIAIRDSEISCENGDKKACGDLVNLYMKAEATEENINLTLSYTDKLCRLDDIKSCKNLAQIYSNKKGIKYNVSLAKEYFSRACALGDKNSCAEFKKLIK